MTNNIINVLENRVVSGTASQNNKIDLALAYYRETGALKGRCLYHNTHSGDNDYCKKP